MKKLLQRLLVVLCLWPLGAACAWAGEQAEGAIESPQPFAEWLVQFRMEAIEQGVKPQVVEAALADVTPIEKIVALDRKQPEGTVTLEQYLAKTLSPLRIRKGREALAEHRPLLAEVEKRYDVPASVIVALWGMETNYGDNAGSFKTIDALVTLAYEGRRSAFFRSELLKALQIMESEQLTSEEFVGSWAGAFGQCQFMPSSFLKYAVDYDDDGHRDIWGNESDIFASIANYLHSEGWQMEGDIKEGSNDFKVLMKWNRSRYFATAVGQLSAHLQAKP